VNLGNVHSTILSFALEPLAASAARPVVGKQTIEGLWWKQEDNVTGFVAVSNLTQRSITADLQISDSEGKSIAKHTVTASSHTTKVVALTEIEQILGLGGM